MQAIRIEDKAVITGAILAMIRELEDKAELHSIGVMYDDEVIAQGAWAPFTLYDPQMMHSLSKLGTSLCVGLAIDEGKLSLDDNFLDYVRDDLPNGYDAALEKVTIRYLLTMRAGSSVFANNVYFTKLEDNWETHWLSEPRIAADVGQVFHYDSGCSYTLSRIVTKVMGKSCIELLQERIFDKLGLPQINWLQSPQGHNTGGWGMYLTVPHLLRIGQLLVEDGMCNGKQLIPQWWLQEMRSRHVGLPVESTNRAIDSYGYHIMTGRNLYVAAGAFGNCLICFRDQPLIVAVTAGTNCADIVPIVQKHIMRKKTNEVEEHELVRILRTLSLPFADGESSVSKMETVLFDRWITLKDNPRGLERVYFTRLSDSQIKIEFAHSGQMFSCSAGFGVWINNDLFPDDFQLLLVRQCSCIINP